MKRRDFLKGASGVAGGAAATGAASSVGAGQPTTSTPGTETEDGTVPGTGTATATTNGTTMTGASGPSGSTEEVVVGPDGEFVFDPAELEIRPGTTVRWVWDSNNHNVVVDDQPEGAEWEGTEGGAGTTYDAGHTYEFTFEQEGTYEYACEPHRAAGMLGTVVVSQDAGAEASGGPRLPESATTLGVAMVATMVSTLSFAYFFLKYGGDYEAPG